LSIQVLDIQEIDKLDLSHDESGNFSNINDVMKLGGMVNDAYMGAQGYLGSLARTWEENIHFFMGNQYIRWNNHFRRFDPLPNNKYTKWIPRPTTNFILPIVQSIASVFTSRKPSVGVRPNSTDEADINAAKLAERLQDLKWEENDEQRLSLLAVIVMCLTGTVIRKDYWDSTAGPTIKTGNVDEDGNEEEIPLGDNAVEILDPFRVIPDLNVIKPEDSPWFLESNIKPLSWVREAYGRTGDGFTGYADKIKEDHNLSSIMQIFNRLKTSESSGNYIYGEGSSNQDTLKNNTVLLEAYIEPTKNYPKGIFTCVSGKKTLYVGDSPYYEDQYKNSWHPFTFCKFQDVGFRFHGLSLVENLVSLQKRLNEIDATIILTRQRMGSPQILMPKGHGIPHGYISGEPGLLIEWDNLSANGSSPIIFPAADVSQSTLAERKNIVDEMHKIAGTNEILSGQRPVGVNSAAGLHLLKEQSYDKFSNPVHNLEKYYEESQTKKMRVWSKFAREPRPDMIKRLQYMNKDNLDLQIVNFIGADLRDNVSIRIEAGSSLPRSKAYELQALQEAMQAGLLGQVDPQTNPVGNKEILEKFGITGISTVANSDVERAKWINGVLVSINRDQLEIDSYPPILPMDDLNIHMKILTDYMKKPKFKDPKQVFVQRYEQIKSILEQQEAEAMQQQMMQQMGQPPGEIPPEGEPVPPEVAPPVEEGLAEGSPIGQ